MAITPRIITQKTRLFAALLALGIASFGVLAAELAPSRMVTDDPMATSYTAQTTLVPRVPQHTLFPPTTVRADDALCGWTADHAHKHFDALRYESTTFDMRAQSIVRLVEVYIDAGCPNRIHDGRWDVTAEILGVGLVAEHVAADPRADDLSERFPARAVDLVPAAATTFHLLAPSAMCAEAARGSMLLTRSCDETMTWFY